MADMNRDAPSSLQGMHTSGAWAQMDAHIGIILSPIAAVVAALVLLHTRTHEQKNKKWEECPLLLQLLGYYCCYYSAAAAAAVRGSPLARIGCLKRFRIL